jgi:hypothetical protein
LESDLLYQWFYVRRFSLETNVSTKLESPMIVVFEKRPYYGPELQRQFLGSAVVVKECRSVTDLLPSSSGATSSLIVLDLESATGDYLQWFRSDVPRHPMRVPIIAIASQELAEIEWILRDAGVTAFVPDLISGNDLARLCRRQLVLTG